MAGLQAYMAGFYTFIEEDRQLQSQLWRVRTSCFRCCADMTKYSIQSIFLVGSWARGYKKRQLKKLLSWRKIDNNTRTEKGDQWNLPILSERTIFYMVYHTFLCTRQVWGASTNTTYLVHIIPHSKKNSIIVGSKKQNILHDAMSYKTLKMRLARIGRISYKYATYANTQSSRRSTWFDPLTAPPP